MDTPDLSVSPENISWGWYVTSTLLSLIGAGIGLGIKLSRGESVNKWHVATSLTAGMAVADTCTQGMINLLGVQYAGFSGGISLLLGLLAIGFCTNALDGKIAFVNKFTGGGPK